MRKIKPPKVRVRETCDRAAKAVKDALRAKRRLKLAIRRAQHLLSKPIYPF